MNIYSLEKFEKKSKVEIIFLFLKKCENLTLGEHLITGTLF